MYKKSADLIHLHERTGSHATKSSATGKPWFEPLSDHEKDLIELKRAREIAYKQFQKIRAIKNHAREKGDKQVIKECNRAMRQITKNVKKIRDSKGIEGYIDGIKFKW